MKCKKPCSEGVHVSHTQSHGRHGQLRAWTLVGKPHDWGLEGCPGPQPPAGARPPGAELLSRLGTRTAAATRSVPGPRALVFYSQKGSRVLSCRTPPFPASLNATTSPSTPLTCQVHVTTGPGNGSSCLCLASTETPGLSCRRTRLRDSFQRSAASPEFSVYSLRQS